MDSIRERVMADGSMLLVIDTATAACSAALLDGDGAVIDERHEIVGRGHAERLVPMIAELLGGRRPGAILVDCGPGSFTGVRVGLAAAHGPARSAGGVPLAGFSSMAALAAAAGEAARSRLRLTGGHGELFVQSFGDDPLAPLDDAALAPARRGGGAAIARRPGRSARAPRRWSRARGYGRGGRRLPRAADARLLPAPLALAAAPPDLRPRARREADDDERARRSPLVAKAASPISTR